MQLHCSTSARVADFLRSFPSFVSVLIQQISSARPVAAVVAVVPAWLPVLLMAIAVAMMIVVAMWLHFYSQQTRELRASEERFRALFQNAVEGVYENPPEGGFSRVNPAMARILGYPTAAEVVKITPEQCARIYVSPTRREEFFALLGANDHVADFESEIRRPDGSTVWIKENVRAVRDARGRLLYLQGFVSDVTARTEAERALRASEERYRVLFEHLPIGIVEYDYRTVAKWFDHLRASGVTDLGRWLDDHPGELRLANSRISVVGANAAALRLFGARDIADGIANLERIYTPEVYAARRHTIVTLWNGRTQADGEFNVHTLNGRSLRVFYHWRIPVIEGRRHYERTQLALVDLTEIKSTELALAEERQRLSVTLRAMSDAVFTVDPTGVVQFMNEAAAELTAWPAGGAVGRPLREVCVLGSDRASQPPIDPVAAALSAHRAVELGAHMIVQPRDGPPRRVEGRCAPMHDVGGRDLGAVLVLRDVTQRLQLEADLLRASKMESIGVLAGGIAHDFNNLLAVIMGNLTLALLDENVRQAGERWLREAERGALRARELTQQLLTFARGGDPVRAAVRLADVVREAAEFALHGAAVRCEFDLTDDLRAADADKGQIGQVVQNLVINAVQAMPEGGTIRLSLRNETLPARALGALAAGDYVRLEISDTGRGIAAEHLPRIFEPFFTTKEYGTGLGLATVYSIIHKHDGHISVESAAGRGTAFRMWLPAARAEPPPPTVTPSPFRSIRGRVLFMDDEEPIRLVTKALLERLGLEATVTADGAEAVDAYARASEEGRDFDVVIVDLTVPGAMGGAEAMREILKINPAARGIVSSGYSSNPVMANYRAHGFRGMVPKPYRVPDFARTIREVLDGG
jgi:PAS domain S-box-containing protein